MPAEVLRELFQRLLNSQGVALALDVVMPRTLDAHEGVETDKSVEL